MCTSDLRHAVGGAALALLSSLLAACGAPESPAASGAPHADASSSGRPAAVSASAPAGTGAAGGQSLVNPDALQMVLLGYRLLGRQPPFAEWAAAQYAVQSANEFDRPAALQREQQRLQAVYASTAGVGRLRLQVSANLSEYDAGRGGYYLDAFSPGTFFTFTAQPDSHHEEKVSLSVDNDAELNFWPLDADAARQVLEKNGGSRSVTLDSEFLLAGATQRSDGPVIGARLQRYAIIASRYGQASQLGARVIESQ
ncbi:hypothetical protein [Solimonas soli]|uniref:hypothetical protein n=1 Tax=Solimonas soli TaxID=413479 RepID=UPI0004815E73|nr:hypothetical protein [Solimonas soli]